jgi:hypothetical protein
MAGEGQGQFRKHQKPLNYKRRDLKDASFAKKVTTHVKLLDTVSWIKNRPPMRGLLFYLEWLAGREGKKKPTIIDDYNHYQCASQKKIISRVVLISFLLLTVSANAHINNRFP